MSTTVLFEYIRSIQLLWKAAEELTQHGVRSDERRDDIGRTIRIESESQLESDPDTMIANRMYCGGESSRERTRVPNPTLRIGPAGLSLISLNYSCQKSISHLTPSQ